jgi:[protein-PII] uridylyltransferase
MPVAYLLNTRPEQIALHIRMVETLRNAQQAVVEFDNDMGTEVTTIYLCTVDRPEPGLLCEIAGVLYAHEISIHAAQVYTSGAADSAIALDTLYADYHGRGIPPLKRLELEQDLQNVLRDGGVEELMAKMGKTLPPPIPPLQVTLDNGATEHHTIVQLQTEDQPALLYRAARAMATLGWNIHSARISTIGTRVRDAFYVTARDGGKLPDEAGFVDAFQAEFAR